MSTDQLQANEGFLVRWDRDRGGDGAGFGIGWLKMDHFGHFGTNLMKMGHFDRNFDHFEI